MRVRLLLAAGVLSFVPTIVRAQDVPAAAPIAAPVSVHREGSLELTAGGGLSLIYPDFNTYLGGLTVRIANFHPGAVMLGGQLRATYNLTRFVSFGVGAGMTNGNGALLIAPFGALTLNFSLNKKFTPFVDVGAGVTRIAAYSGGISGDPTRRLTSSYSIFGGIGLRRMITNTLGIRVEGRASYDRFAEYGKPALNGAAFAGLSLFVGGRAPRDSDRDGVPDAMDPCPDTPAGAMVDAQGCALDSDTDGVFDGLDQCADTPRGATVDALGCALDSDTDGIFDGLDRCPDTPPDARPVDVNGCPVDSDSDGVPDYLDRCPNTPAGVPVDASGCPRDTDGDGVSDDQDRCPDTPADARPVYPAGHARAGCPMDSDGDGVPDYLDRCANTAAGTQVDAGGCPLLRDSDSDGVTDDRDRCPDTAANVRVDAIGCPLASLPAEGFAMVLRNITFRQNTAELLPASSAELDNIAASLLSVPEARWEIAGYTDNRGIAARNLQLSRQRAVAVMRYLLAKGVPSTSLVAVGYGGRNPAASNLTVVGRAQNRRVEIRRLP